MAMRKFKASTGGRKKRKGYPLGLAATFNRGVGRILEAKAEGGDVSKAISALEIEITNYKGNKTSDFDGTSDTSAQSKVTEGRIPSSGSLHPDEKDKKQNEDYFHQRKMAMKKL